MVMMIGRFLSRVDGHAGRILALLPNRWPGHRASSICCDWRGCHKRQWNIELFLCTRLADVNLETTRIHSQLAAGPRLRDLVAGPI